MRAIILFAVTVIGCAQPFTEDERVRTQIVETKSAVLPSCGEGWGAPADSFAGIDGSFERVGPTPIGELKSLALFAVEDPRARIVSEAHAVHIPECGLASCPALSARASMLPAGTAMNPMILFSANGFNRADPDMRGFYDVLGIERDDWGTITALCLRRADTLKESAPFLLSRAHDTSR